MHSNQLKKQASLLTSKFVSYKEASLYFAISISRMKDFAPALKHIADIIERGIREHPELSVGMQTEGIEVREGGSSGV